LRAAFDLADVPRPPSPEASFADILPLADTEAAAISDRIDRLESGVRVMAESLQHALNEVAARLEAIRREADFMMVARVERAVSEAIEPLNHSVTEVARSVEGLPNVVVSATDQLVERVERAQSQVKETVLDLATAAREKDTRMATSPRGRRPA
jgi:predicted component of type VI protein secretion system